MINRNGDTVRSFSYADGLMVTQSNALGLGCHYRWQTLGDKPRVLFRNSGYEGNRVSNILEKEVLDKIFTDKMYLLVLFQVKLHLKLRFY